MKEYTLSDGTAVTIKSYEEWLWDRIHMTENTFREKLDKRKKPLFEDRYWPTDNVIGLYHDKYRQYVDRIHLDHMSLTFPEYFEAYEGHTFDLFHEMCAETGLSRADETAWYESIRKAWEGHENNIIPF